MDLIREGPANNDLSKTTCWERARSIIDSKGPSYIDDFINEVYPYVLHRSIQFAKHYDDGEDLAQESIIKVFKNIDAINDSNAIKTWLDKIISNTAIDSGRRVESEKVSRAEYLKFEEEKVTEVERSIRKNKVGSITDQHMIDITLSEIIEYMCSMRGISRDVVYLKYFCGYTITEVMDALRAKRGKKIKITENSIKCICHRFRKKAKEIKSAVDKNNLGR